MDIVQQQRLIALESTPLGGDVLLLEGFSGEEKLSSLFEFSLECLSRSPDIAPSAIVGKRIAFSVRYADEGRRPFNGFVHRLIAGNVHGHGLRQYRIEVVPWLWFLTLTTDCRIFQEKTIPQIVEQVFRDNGFTDFDSSRITGSHPQHDYCVQYLESDFAFVSRLLEEEGIFYWFT